jgi:hypothetical protein
MVWARAQKAGSPGAKALLLLLGELANDHSETYRDQTFIADILEVSRETVSRNLKVLEKAGLVTLTKQFDKAGQRRPNLITLHVTNPHIEAMEPDQPCDDSSHSPCDDSSQQYKHSLNKHSSTTNVVEEAPAAPRPEPEALPMDLPAPAKAKRPRATKAEDAALNRDAQYVARTLVELHPALKFEAVMGTAKRMMKAYKLPANVVGKAMEGIYLSGRGALVDQRVGQVLEGIISAQGSAPIIDRTAEKMQNTMTMKLPGTPAESGQLAITEDPFLQAFRITA